MINEKKGLNIDHFNTSFRSCSILGMMGRSQEPLHEVSALTDADGQDAERGVPQCGPRSQVTLRVY